ncbi:MAG: caspase family protein [Proteobacteria bacterium]|nr:caspase family protein [Pseudomonadota bacterium]
MSLLLAILLGAASAEDVRIGIFVGNDDGGASQKPLIFATSDAEKMRDLFVQHGQIAEKNALLLTDEPTRNVESAFVIAGQRLAEAEARGAHTTLIFYYSGHGDDHGLKLGNSTLEHEALRGWLESSGADVRVAFLDACQSGGAVREKGGTRGPSYAFAVDASRIEGTAFVTSSAATEFSQESDEIGGGFFTHYLHGALAGAADADGDGDVTLAETYAYVHTETAFATRDAPGSQSPVVDLDLTGEGSVRLTRLDAESAFIRFGGGMEGTYAVWDETRRRYVAEVDGARASKLAVRPGTYFLHHRMPGWVDQAELQVGRGESVDVDDAAFLSLAYEDTAARGDLERQVRRAEMPGFSLRGVVGARGFGDTPIGRQYLPAHAIAGVSARFLSRKSGPGPYFGADLLSGAGPSKLQFAELEPVDVVVSSTSVGATAGFATAPALFRAGVGGRAEIIVFTRSFPNGETESQTATGIAPGLGAWVGVHHGRFVADLSFDLLRFSVNLEGSGQPVYGEFGLSLGYRF